MVPKCNKVLASLKAKDQGTSKDGQRSLYLMSSAGGRSRALGVVVLKRGRAGSLKTSSIQFYMCL